MIANSARVRRTPDRRHGGLSPQPGCEFVCKVVRRLAAASGRAPRWGDTGSLPIPSPTHSGSKLPHSKGVLVKHIFNLYELMGEVEEAIRLATTERIRLLGSDGKA